MSPLARALARRRRLRGDRGAAAVEFALVSLLLFMLLFGIIEFGLAIRDKIAVTSAVRTGGRVASAEPKACDIGASGCAVTSDPVTLTPVGNSSMVADTVRATMAALTGVPTSSIQELWVYAANAEGKPLSTGSLSSTSGCAAKCLWYKWDPTYDSGVGRFRYAGGGGWKQGQIDACPGLNATSVGVYLKINHQFILGGIVGGTSINLSDYSAFRFEPQPALVGLSGASGCAATSP
jgi:hypothetical protein